ncbi:hypothetical protein HN865_03575 [Candidatus Woesearchaeota archaeon]|jgi:hypothetical protein|nr:hypothetical protein [Candidatus Woesearchaeota archaeon]
MSFINFFKLTKLKIVSFIGFIFIYLILLIILSIKSCSSTVSLWYCIQTSSTIADVIIIVVLAYLFTNISYSLKNKFMSKNPFILSLTISAILILLISLFFMGIFSTVVHEISDIEKPSLTKNEIEDFVNSCISSTANEKLSEIRNLPDEEIKKELEDYINSNLINCLKTKEKITVGEVKTNSKINNEEITILVSVPIKVIKEFSIVELNSFVVKVLK